jgi:hypothetical protein
MTRQGGRLVTVAEGTLDAGLAVRLEVRPVKQRTKYVVLLRSTEAHTASREAIRVIRSDQE